MDRDPRKSNVRTELSDLVERYRRSPEFLSIDLSDVNARGMTGDTLLHAAVTRGELNHVRILIACGASVNAIGDLGNTPLHYAASRGLVEIARKLIQCGADINIRDEFGQTPLDLAKLMERKEVVKLFKQLKRNGRV
jgi:ankyrin repeat protein